MITDFEATYFRRCAGLDGRIHDVDVFHQNRQLVARFSPELWIPAADESPEADEPSADFLDGLCSGLTVRQREVFLMCLETPSYAEAGRRLGISHVAVIDHLKRMSSRNRYVRAFRENRQRKDL
jgi:DNA-directed RNA polymerase specialized sigma24 family protein